MENLFSSIINAEEIFRVQSKQREDRLLLTGTVAAKTMQLFKVSVSNDGHFLSRFITGSYTTLRTIEGAVVDTGVNYLRGLIRDQGMNKPLFNDFVPLELFLSPGRRKSDLSTTILTDPAASPLFFKFQFEHLFTVNSDITLEVKNDSNTLNSFNICFHGTRVYQ